MHRFVEMTGSVPQGAVGVVLTCALVLALAGLAIALQDVVPAQGMPNASVGMGFDYIKGSTVARAVVSEPPKDSAQHLSTMSAGGPRGPGGGHGREDVITLYVKTPPPMLHLADQGLDDNYRDPAATQKLQAAGPRGPVDLHAWMEEAAKSDEGDGMPCLTYLLTRALTPHPGANGERGTRSPRRSVTPMPVSTASARSAGRLDIKTSYDFCESTQKFKDEFSCGLSGSYKGIGWKVSGAADFMKETGTSNYSMYTICKATALAENTETIGDADPVLSEEAKKLLTDRNKEPEERLESFHSRYGHRWISALTTGFRYTGVYRITTTDQLNRMNIKASLRGEYGGAEAEVHMAKAAEESLKNSQVSVHEHFCGGGNAPQPATTREGLLKNFEAASKFKGAPYLWTLSSYIQFSEYENMLNECDPEYSPLSALDEYNECILMAQRVNQAKSSAEDLEDVTHYGNVTELLDFGATELHWEDAEEWAKATKKHAEEFEKSLNAAIHDFEEFGQRRGRPVYQRARGRDGITDRYYKNPTLDQFLTAFAHDHPPLLDEMWRQLEDVTVYKEGGEELWTNAQRGYKGNRGDNKIAPWASVYAQILHDGIEIGPHHRQILGKGLRGEIHEGTEPPKWRDILETKGTTGRNVVLWEAPTGWKFTEIKNPPQASSPTHGRGVGHEVANVLL